MRRSAARHGSLVGALAWLGLGGLAGCSSETPTEVEVQTIEEVEFASELDIDLSQFTKLGTGVYRRDIVLGPDSAAAATYGTTVTITFTGWLADGRVFAEGTVGFIMGAFQMPIGLEEGMVNQRVGGTRVVLVPAHLGYGGIDQVHVLGTLVIPAGSVLVYEVMLDEVR